MADARRLLASLVGPPLRTVTGRENRVLGIESDSVQSWTSRSPSGRPVPVAWVQEALDRVERDGEIEISVQSVGYRTAFIGAVLRKLPGTEVVRSASPPRIQSSRVAGSSPTRVNPRVVLLGCVKLKVDHRAVTKDLYRSPLWAGRRAYAETSGHPWLILSAMHGHVDPEAQLEPTTMAFAIGPSHGPRLLRSP